MLPDFPKVKEVVGDLINHAIRSMVDSRPLIAMFQKERHFEGSGWAPYGADNDPDRHRYKEFKQPHEISKDTLIAKGPDAIAEQLPVLAEAMATKIESHMKERMSRAAAEGSPHVAVFQGTPRSCDELLRLLEGMEIDFDDDGKAIMPGLIVTDRAIVERLMEFEADEGCRAKLDALLARKREDFDAREAARELVD